MSVSDDVKIELARRLLTCDPIKIPLSDGRVVTLHPDGTLSSETYVVVSPPPPTPNERPEADEVESSLVLLKDELDRIRSESIEHTESITSEVQELRSMLK